jgi:hypothetical protein
MPTLTSCSSCKTHIRSDEVTCPFCSAAQSAPRRLLTKLRIASALAIAGCAYGLPPAPPIDAGKVVDAGVTHDAPPVLDAH